MSAETAYGYYQQQLLKRARILPDTCGLFLTAASIPNQFLINQPAEGKLNPNLLEVFSILDSYGFSFHVPEMVTVEAASVMRDGKSIDLYFDDNETKFSKKASMLSKKLATHLAEEQNAGRLKIVPPQKNDNSDPAKYIRELWQIHASSQLYHEKKRNIKKVQGKRRGKKKDFGDIAACELLRTLPSDGRPIFYLSEDSEALNKILAVRQDIPVYQLTFRSLLQALYDNGILAKLGVQTPTVDALAQAIVSSLCEHYEISSTMLSAFTRDRSIGRAAFHEILRECVIAGSREEELMEPKKKNQVISRGSKRTLLRRIQRQRARARAMQISP